MWKNVLGLFRFWASILLIYVVCVILIIWYKGQKGSHTCKIILSSAEYRSIYDFFFVFVPYFISWVQSETCNGKLSCLFLPEATTCVAQSDIVEIAFQWIEISSCRTIVATCLLIFVSQQSQLLLQQYVFSSSLCMQPWAAIGIFHVKNLNLIFRTCNSWINKPGTLTKRILHVH